LLALLAAGLVALIAARRGATAGTTETFVASPGLLASDIGSGFVDVETDAWLQTLGRGRLGVKTADAAAAAASEMVPLRRALEEEHLLATIAAGRLRPPRTGKEAHTEDDSENEQCDVVEDEDQPAGEGAACDEQAPSQTSAKLINKRSTVAGCQATSGPREDPNFLSSVRPCGNYSSLCTDIPLVEANKDYPGGGIGAVVPGQDYVVQFDIGLHPAVARDVLKRQLGEIDSCAHCPAFEERCFETVVTGGAMWGDLGMPSVAPTAYDCMGACGKGCSNVFGRTEDDIGALDCLKHDLCSAWKSLRIGQAARGFCHDPDCGDEAAMSIFNCWSGFRLFGSMGGSRSGPFSEPAVCEEHTTRGCWSHGGWFTMGRCKVFQGWRRGQGIPDPHPLRSPIQRL